MTILLEIKEFITEFYKRFEKIINPVGKFLFSLIVLVRLNSFLGYNAALNKFIVSVALAVVATFIPASWFLLILIAVICGQLMSISLEATLIMGIAMIVVYLLFVRIFPKMAFFVMLVPLCFYFKIAYIVPIIAGLFFGPTSIVAVATGVLVYKFSFYLPGLLEKNSSTLYDIPKTVMSMYEYITNAVTHDMGMMLTILVFSGVLGITYLISKLDYDYVWYIAIAIGGIVNILGFVIGTLILKADVSIFGVIIGTIVAILVCAFIQFMRFSLDYQRAEKVQFEDDVYYYFVKALPKIKITKAQRAVTKIK